MSTMLPSREERLEFLEKRRDGVGGSDVAAICNLDPYRTPFDVYIEKTREPDPSQADNIHLIRGQLLEDVFAELYAAESGREVRRMGQRVHRKYDWARVNVDRQILDTGHGKGTGALEVKSPGREGFQNLIESGLPERYIVQVQWEMEVPDYDWASFAAGNLEHSGGPLVYFDVERNPLLIEQLLERVERFWLDHVLERKPPHPSEWEPDPPEVPDTSGERVLVEDPAFAREAEVLMRRYENRKLAKDQYEQQKKKVKELMDDTERVVVPGVGKVNYIWQDGRTRFKDDLLRDYGALDPDAVLGLLEDELGEESAPLAERLLTECQLDFTMFEKQGKPYRRFRPYPASD